MEPTERPLTPQQAAELFAVDPESVRRWAESGKLLAFKTPGGQWRFPRAETIAAASVHRNEAS